MKTTGEKIKDRRLTLKLTQQELADRVGVTIRAISGYETGKMKPRGINLRELSHVLGVSEEYLLRDEIEDETYGLEEAPYVDLVRTTFGRHDGDAMQRLLEANQALFAGGDIPQEDKDKFFNAVMAAYVATKNDASERFGNKRFKK